MTLEYRLYFTVGITVAFVIAFTVLFFVHLQCLAFDLACARLKFSFLISDAMCLCFYAFFSLLMANCLCKIGPISSLAKRTE